MRSYWVYILCSKRNGTLYIGVTNDLARRIYEHREKIADGFTKKYNVTQLVHAEEFQDINDALSREKSLKKFDRVQKLQLIEKYNPKWEDLYNNIL